MNHRFIDWKGLPPLCQTVLEAYDEARLKGAPSFICKEDGRPLLRNDMLDLYDICLLHTSWRHLYLVPHAFRLGGATNARLEGKAIEEILFQGRWNQGSSVLEVYTRVDMAVLSPQVLYEKKPKHR